MSSAGPAHPAVLATRWPLVGRHEEVEQVGDAVVAGDVNAVVIYGAAGVGKTRLADECLEYALRAGRTGGRAAASAGASGLSLGALIPLLPVEVVDYRFDPVGLYRTVADAFRVQAGGLSYVLVVDDLHRLDASSATLLSQLIDARVVFLIATIRTGEPTTDAVAELWRRDRVLRIDLDDLSREDVDTLLHLALGGPVDAATAESIATTAQGNVLFVRELVLGARAAGRLQERQGVWRLTGPIAPTARLAELVDARLAAVPTGAGDLLALLALAEPVGLAELESFVGAEAIEMVDGAELLNLRNDGRRRQVSLTHPLYAEVVRDRMSPFTQRRLLACYVELINARGARRREDALRVANARLDADGTADAELLLTAARLARHGHDHPQVVRLASASLAEVALPEALLLLAESLHELGEYEEAERVLEQHASVADGAEDRWRVPLVEMRARNLFWGLCRLDDSLALNRAARATFASVEIREELLIDEGMAYAMSGYPIEALAAIEDAPGLTPRARMLRSIVEAPALTMIGRCVTSAALSRRAYREHEALGDQIAVAHPAVHLIHLMHAQLDQGQFESVSRMSNEAYRISIGIAAPAGQVWWAYGIGRAAMMTGRLQTARRWFGEAAGLSQGRLHPQHRVVLSMLAACLAQLDEAGAAQQAVAELDALAPFTYRAGEQAIGRGWALVASGDLQSARDLLRAAAAAMQDTGQFGQEAWLRHEVVRLGDAGSERARLDELESLCEGELVPVYAFHARAATGRAPGALEEAVERFAALGANLLAAEAATAAADAFRRAGDPRAATAMAARASGFADACEGARTPGLHTTTTAPTPLTGREREIATLAAQRLSSKEIAARLHLSARTVDNHLQRIYTKLGVTGRAELAEALE